MTLKLQAGHSCPIGIPYIKKFSPGFNFCWVCNLLEIAKKRQIEKLELNLSGHPTGRSPSFHEKGFLKWFETEVVSEMSWTMCLKYLKYRNLKRLDVKSRKYFVPLCNWHFHTLMQSWMYRTPQRIRIFYTVLHRSLEQTLQFELYWLKIEIEFGNKFFH